MCSSETYKVDYLFLFVVYTSSVFYHQQSLSVFLRRRYYRQKKRRFPSNLFSLDFVHLPHVSNRGTGTDITEAMNQSELANARSFVPFWLSDDVFASEEKSLFHGIFYNSSRQRFKIMYFDKKGGCYDNGRNGNFSDDTNDPQ